MISTSSEFEQALAELGDLQDRLDTLQRNHPIGEKGFTKAGRIVNNTASRGADLVPKGQPWASIALSIRDEMQQRHIKHRAAMLRKWQVQNRG